MLLGAPRGYRCASEPTTPIACPRPTTSSVAEKNPRFAHEQLGITAKIFEAHYNQPALEDRLESRDILPGAVTATPRTPDEMVGQAWLKYWQGRLSRADFEATVLQAEKLKAAPSTRVPETSAYG